MTTEFLLYLVSIALIVFIIIHYFTGDDETKIIPVYKKEDNNTSNQNNQYNQNNQHTQHNQNAQYMQQGQYGQQGHGYVGGAGQYGAHGAPHGGRFGGPAVGGQIGGVVGGPIGGPIGGPVGGPAVGPAGAGVVPPPDPYIKLLEHDVRQIDDPLVPPYSRSYYDDEYAYLYPPALAPFYNRHEGKFRKIGLLIGQGLGNNDKYKFLNLIGRQKFRNREYEYYIISTDKENNLKFEIDTKGREIRDGDLVKIPELDNQEYMYKEDEDISPKYNPFIY